MASQRDQNTTVLEEARIEAGVLLRRIQQGESLALPYSRPMASIGKRCHELRVTDKEHEWRIVYRVDVDAIVIGDVFREEDQEDPAERDRALPEASRGVRSGG